MSVSFFLSKMFIFIYSLNFFSSLFIKKNLLFESMLSALDCDAYVEQHFY